MNFESVTTEKDFKRWSAKSKDALITETLQAKTSVSDAKVYISFDALEWKFPQFGALLQATKTHGTQRADPPAEFETRRAHSEEKLSCRMIKTN